MLYRYPTEVVPFGWVGSSNLYGLMILSVDRRFQGSTGIAQGGYLAGLVSELLGLDISVSFHRPAPVDEKLHLSTEEGTYKLLGSTGLVLEARDLRKAPDPSPPVSWRRAVEARSSVARDPFARDRACFMCGDHSESLGIQAGPVNQSQISATPVVFPDWTATDGIVAARFLWAALDCPAGWSVSLDSRDLSAVTGGLSAMMFAPINPGVPLVVTAVPEKHWTGRTRRAHSAIYDSNGKLIASAESIWVALRQPTPD